MNYKQGDRVVFVRDVDDGVVVSAGMTGTVDVGDRECKMSEYELDVIVDDLTGSHDGDANDDTDDHIYCATADVVPINGSGTNLEFDLHSGGMVVLKPCEGGTYRIALIA